MDKTESLINKLFLLKDKYVEKLVNQYSKEDLINKCYDINMWTLNFGNIIMKLEDEEDVEPIVLFLEDKVNDMLYNNGFNFLTDMAERYDKWKDNDYQSLGYDGWDNFFTDYMSSNE